MNYLSDNNLQIRVLCFVDRKSGHNIYTNDKHFVGLYSASDTL